MLTDHVEDHNKVELTLRATEKLDEESEKLLKLLLSVVDLLEDPTPQHLANVIPSVAAIRLLRLCATTCSSVM